jgi:DNA repair protein RAD51
MAADAEDAQSAYEDGGMGGPGAPTPLTSLEVRSHEDVISHRLIPRLQGVAGLTARDIKLVIDGGFNTVESVAYT